MHTKFGCDRIAYVLALQLGLVACSASSGQTNGDVGAGGESGSSSSNGGDTGTGGTTGEGVGGSTSQEPPPNSGGATNGGFGNSGGTPVSGSGGQNGGGGGTASSGGSGGAGGVGGTTADAGTGGTPSADAGGGSNTDPCAGGEVGSAGTGIGTGSEYGAVKYQLPLDNQIVDLKTTLVVPKKPTAQGTLFIWPGLQWLGGSDPASLGNGILQPVLTWGSSCAPSMPQDYSSWWISGMYVNVSTGAAGPTGCAGGDSMNVADGDALDIDMALTGTTWKQTIMDEATGKPVDFSIDLKGQSQDWATWAIELPVGGGNVAPSEGVVFKNNVLTFAKKASTCQPDQRGPNDTFTAPRASTDGLSCCISQIVLRAKGVAQ